MAAADLESDFLVIGSGIAGLLFALEASKLGSVRIVTKKDPAESSTNYAQGGIASAVAPGDTPEAHLSDTLIAGDGLCDEPAVAVLVEEGPERIRELMALGTRFTRRDDGSLDLGREGGHTRNRIVHAADLTGAEVERALLEALHARDNVEVHEHVAAIELVTEHHLGDRPPDVRRRSCYGAYAFDARAGRVLTLAAHRTLLATGGCGQIYLHTTNPAVATGDGYAMAYRAGAVLANLEFMQFHPTTLHDPGTPGTFLISEAVRGHGAILRDRAGERFMTRYDARLELAPRDVVARAIDAELKRTGAESVFLDATHLPAGDFARHFPNISARCAAAGIDVASVWIPVVPAAHYQCGGVRTDLSGRTSIGGLFASGEVAWTGVHGANRLASNSLLEGLVFSHRAAREIARDWTGRPPPLPELPPWNDSHTFNVEEWIMIAHDRRDVQQLLWDYVGIVRSNARLLRARRRLELIRNEIEEYFRRTRVSLELIELRNLAETALLVVDAALMRKESRGLHYTTDYPERDDRLWRRDTILEKAVV